MQKYGQISGATVFTESERYLLVAETYEIVGDTLYVSQECNIHSQFLPYTYSRLYTRSLHTRRNETRVKSPDACNAFFIKVSTLSLSLSLSLAPGVFRNLNLYQSLNTY